MSRLPVPIVTIVTGEGGSGGALALAAADRVLMLENSYYSVISPEGCATILFKDALAAPRAAAALRMTAPTCCGSGSWTRSCPSPRRARTPTRSRPPRTSRPRSSTSLRELLGASADDLLEQRYERFRAFGAPGRPAGTPVRGEPDDIDNATAPIEELLRRVWRRPAT